MIADNKVTAPDREQFINALPDLCVSVADIAQDDKPVILPVEAGTIKTL